MTLVWGVHYIVVKDALSDLAPLTFNAIRFSIGLPVILLAGLQRPAALRIARYLGTRAEFWLDLQTDYDLAVAEQDFGEAIMREVEAA